MEPISLKLHIYIWPRSLMFKSHYRLTDVGVASVKWLKGVSPVSGSRCPHCTKSICINWAPTSWNLKQKDQVVIVHRRDRAVIFYLGCAFKERVEKLWQKYHKKRQHSSLCACSVVSQAISFSDLLDQQISLALHLLLQYAERRYCITVSSCNVEYTSIWFLLLDHNNINRKTTFWIH